MTIIFPSAIATHRYRNTTLTNITPFTMRDAYTYEELLEGLHSYIGNHLVPYLTDVNVNIGETLNNFIEDVQSEIANNQNLVDSKIADLENRVANNSIQIQDIVVEAIINNKNSPAYTALEDAIDRLTGENLSNPNSLTTSNLKPVFDPNVSVLLGDKSTATGVQFARTTPKVVRVEAGIDGMPTSATVDATQALQAIIDKAGRGATIVVGTPPGGLTWLINGTVVFNKGQQRFVGSGADVYSSSFTKNNAGAIFRVENAGHIFDQISFRSDASSTAFDTTSVAKGIDFVGAPAGDIDAHVLRCCFINMAQGIGMYGRNLRVEDSLFSNSKRGIYVGGKDSSYHNSNYDSRDLLAYNNRFHSMKGDGSNAAIQISPDANQRYHTIRNNFFDFITGHCIMVTGVDPANRANNIVVDGNDFIYLYGDGSAVWFDQVARSGISNCHIQGNQNSLPTHPGAGVTVKNATDIALDNVKVYTHDRGITFDNVADCTASACISNNNLKNGFEFGNSVARTYLMMPKATGNVGHGFYSATANSGIGGRFAIAASNVAGQITNLPAVTGWS